MVNQEPKYFNQFVMDADPLYGREDLFQMNQRVLPMQDNNSYHITRGDFNSPTLYTLNLLKTNNRVKVKTFLPVSNKRKLFENGQKLSPFATLSQAEKAAIIKNDQALTKFKSKFYGPIVTSSQINQRRGLKTINIFEKSKAKTYTIPKTRGWKEKEPVPTPMFINL